MVPARKEGDTVGGAFLNTSGPPGPQHPGTYRSQKLLEEMSATSRQPRSPARVSFNVYVIIQAKGLVLVVS